MPRSLSEWLTYIESIYIRGVELGLSRMYQVAVPSQIHKFDIPVITVSGTNGKGSTVEYLRAIYQSEGYRCGTYTSPHLHLFNERIQINGVMVSDEQICQAFNAIEELRMSTPLTYFEFTTLAAFWLFQRAELDVLILEIGLGGRLDAVNCVDCDVAVITTVDIDHTNWLGLHREQIGREKAGIIRELQPVVVGDSHPPQSVLDRAGELSAPLYVSGRDFDFHDQGNDWQFVNTHVSIANLPYPKLPLPNAATAIQVSQLLNDELPVTQAAIRQAMCCASLPGRMQKFMRHN